jgi:hypothetical protein
MNKVLISYCLFGDVTKYYPSLDINIKNISKFNFNIIIICDDINFKILKIKYPSIKIIIGEKYNIQNKMLWRLIPVFLNSSDVLFIRDADSIITDYEFSLMNEFIISEFSFHIIRNHPLHFMPIMGGLFGIKKNFYNIFQIPKISKYLSTTKNIYDHDQFFLANRIYRQVINDALLHVSHYKYLNEKTIPINFDINNYCGSYYKIDTHKNIIKYTNRVSLPFFIAKLLKFKYFYFIKKIND